MVKSLCYVVFFGAVVLCTAGDGAEDALQSGYRAYLNKDYDAAIGFYEQAMVRSSDPGRIAGDLGSILAEAGRYQDAVTAFARCLEDAQGLRRAKAAYGQATALTHVSKQLKGRRAIAVLQRALSGYEIALRELSSLSGEETGLQGDLKSSAEHNRDQARALLLEKQKEPEPPNDSQDENTDPLLDSRLTDPNAGGGIGRGATPLTSRNNATGTETGNSEANAGRGNLPPLPDDDQAPPLSAEEAHRRLDQLLQRLHQPMNPQPAKPGTKDW